MIEEPFRWLEAVANRREYAAEQLKGGSPVFAVSLEAGILLLGVGGGQTKVFELFDRQALAALGHPADIEKLRQTLIDAAHLEAFARAPEDVSLRRLVGYGLGPQLKASFEQIFAAPFLAELLLAELGSSPEKDTFIRLHFDGSFESKHGGVCAAAPGEGLEEAAGKWLGSMVDSKTDLPAATDAALQAWWVATSGSSFSAATPPVEERQKGWRTAAREKTVEIGWLDRLTARPARYRVVSLTELGLA